MPVAFATVLITVAVKLLTPSPVIFVIVLTAQVVKFSEPFTVSLASKGIPRTSFVAGPTFAIPQYQPAGWAETLGM